MKLKAVVAKGCPDKVIAALENSEFRNRIAITVLKEHLRLENPGPAEFYIQECDFAVGGGPMCEVRLTGVSVTKDRSTNDFHRAVEALEKCYREVLEQHLIPSLKEGEGCQLFVSIALDLAPLGETSNLIERQPIWLEHKTS